MTTSHRPQLEARSGAKAAGYTPTSTEHARLLPGHKKVKYRSSNKVGNAGKNYLEDEKKADKLMKAKLISEEEEEEQKEKEEESEESEEEEDSDGELLQQELDRLKKRRLAEETVESEEQWDEKVSVPKLKRKSWRAGTTFSRNEVSKNTKQVVKQNDKTQSYTNNITKSDYHQEFMKKFIK